MSDDNYILLVRQKEADYTFLPGGHIEFGEAARFALVREIEEELGLSVEVGQLLGVIEHKWSTDYHLSHELNLIFSISCEELKSDHSPESREGNLEFLWHPLNDLKSVNLKPPPLCELVPRWLKEKGMTIGWDSTIEKR
ncbi:MAG: NUDIX domain-containing protein [Candidatus Zixiibacteriota bacterium]